MASGVIPPKVCMRNDMATCKEYTVTVVGSGVFASYGRIQSQKKNEDVDVAALIVPPCHSQVTRSRQVSEVGVLTASSTWEVREWRWNQWDHVFQSRGRLLTGQHIRW